MSELALSGYPTTILAVTGSQRPYIFDLPQLLSLPEGFEFRFRYRLTWVQDALLTGGAGGRDSFAGREMVVLHHSQESRRIVPIRSGTIIDLEQLGPMVLLRFRVGPFPKIALDLAKYACPKTIEEASTSAASGAVRALSARASELLGPIEGNESFDLSQPLPAGWYLRGAVRPLQIGDWDQGDGAAAWARIVAVLHGDRNLFGIPFFYLLGFRTEAGTTVTPSAIGNRFRPGLETIHGFALQEFERYRMRVLEWCERPANAPHPRIRLNCEFQRAHLSLEGASNLVVGRYDIVEFTFSAQHPGYSEVGLSADSLDKEDGKDQTHHGGANSRREATSEGKPPAWAEWPTIFAARVPVVVRIKPRRFVTAASAGVIGLVLYIGLAPRIGPDHPIWQNTVELVALAILLVGYRMFQEPLDRFLKLSGGLRRLRGWAQE